MLPRPRLVTALVLVLPSLASPVPDDWRDLMPMTLEWQNAADGQNPWSGEAIDSGTTQWIRLRLRGDESHAGVWCVPVARVWFDDAWFAEAPPQYCHEGLRHVEPWPLSERGFDPFGRMPPCVIPQGEFDALLQRVGGPSDPDKVREVCEPVLMPPQGSPSERRWDLDYYDYFSPAARGFWDDLRSHPDDDHVIVLEAWVKRRIAMQTGGALDPEELWDDPGFLAEVSGHLHMDIQGIFFWSDARDPEQATSEQPPPPGLPGHYMAAGTTTPLGYAYLASPGGNGNGKIYATGTFRPLPTAALTAPGQQVRFRMIGRTGDTWACLEAAGTTPTLLLVPVSAGGGLMQAAITVPAGLPSGVHMTIRGFVSGGVSWPAIPAADRDGFVVP